MRRLIFTAIYQNTFRKLNVNRTRCTGKRVHTPVRKHANLNLSAWSLRLLQPMQNKMKNNVNPYRFLQVMHVRLGRFNSSLIK